ncbi:iron chelate uptake ABC transporter family permease subunit [Rhodococcus chondri]|uniref:Iron chelate uptake ABC transporter family permease subunit n=1 Tax=Rhodococcus chondri TaxID=3065941 RepID=A0ABU7JZG9_9NOCA|nr:iron chelate uptake ABC transporter family permease subunit [Rhodococcus sp. CC-R104]MEE2035408.1 iron chelate uptake ABC transporter family permease subunit [Rhodococcus sp. CC-R104]
MSEVTETGAVPERALRTPAFGRTTVVFAGLVVALVTLAIASACLGQVPTGPAEVVGSVLHRIGLDIGPLPAHPAGEVTLWEVRFPRVVLAILVGAALGCSGALLQGVFANPLAEPGVIGCRPVRRRAVLPQQHTAGFPFTARQVVQMGRAAWTRTPRQDADDRLIAEAFRTCDVAHLADRPFPALSGGERARVALARVLAQDTQTLLLDEPTAALDLGHQETIMQVVRARADQGQAVVVVLHDLGLAAAYADRICVLEQGRVVADGVPARVLTGELLSRVYAYPVRVSAHPESGTPLVLPRRTPPVAAAG